MALPGVRPGWSASMAFGVAQKRTASRSGGCLHRFSGAPDFASVAVGVGQRPERAIPSSVSRVGAPGKVERLLVNVEATGVGKRPNATMSRRPALNVLDSPVPRSRLAFTGLPVLESEARGVGKKEEPLTQVRGTDRGRVEQVPLRIEPELGQRPEYSVEIGCKPRYGLHEDDRGS